MKKKIFYTSVLFFALLCSCNKNNVVVNSTNTIQLHVQNAQHSEWIPVPAWIPSDKKICVVFGYGYNTEEFITEMKKRFEKKYGLAKDGALVYPLVFPDDFKTAGKDRISMLDELLENIQLRGLIIIGAPENTHNAVNALKRQYDGHLPFPVFSFFPQDDILGMEYASDFVLEKAQVSGVIPDNEEAVVITAEVCDVLDNAVHYMSLLDSPLSADSYLHTYVQTLVGNAGTVVRYVDPESGLQAVNHFVLKTNE